MSDYSSYNETQLVKRLKEGDCSAFQQIFNHYKDKLLYYSVSIVKDDGVGKDIVQETFIRLWTTRENLDPDKSLSGYLHTISRNLCLNHIKSAGYDHALKNRLWKKVEQQQLRNRTEEEVFARESRQLVEKAVKLLPSRRRLIFQLSREEGLTHKEIASRLNISKNTVKNQMVTAIKEIRTYLRQHTDVAISWIILFIGLLTF